MKTHTMNIYWINASAVYPVCEAGAVVIAKTAKRALELCDELTDPSKPEKIGTSSRKTERVIVCNTGEY